MQAADALLNSSVPTGAVTLLTDVIAEWSECIADLEEWVHESNQDAFDEAAREFDALLAESLLSLPLTADERKVWCARIDELEDETIDLAILEIVSRAPAQSGFHVLPQRWGVERTFACFGRYRRLSKDDKKTDQEQQGDELPGINPHFAQAHNRSQYNFQMDSQANIPDEYACATPQRGG